MMEIKPKVDKTACFRAAVREGVAQADWGELIEDEDVLRWLNCKDILDPLPLDVAGVAGRHTRLSVNDALTEHF